MGCDDAQAIFMHLQRTVPSQAASGGAAMLPRQHAAVRLGHWDGKRQLLGHERIQSKRTSFDLK